VGQCFAQYGLIPKPSPQALVESFHSVFVRNEPGMLPISELRLVTVGVNDLHPTGGATVLGALRLGVAKSREQPSYLGPNALAKFHIESVTKESAVGRSSSTHLAESKVPKA